MKKFEFSIIIAAYNSDLWISKSINSLINQTLDFEDNVQVILINDGSVDNTGRICQEYKAKYPKNIIYINNEKNMGASYSRNIGLKQASGKYINFLDSDDYISRYTLSGVLNFFSVHDDADLVSIPIHFFGEKTGEHPLNFKYEEEKVVNLLKNPEYVQLSASSCFFKREAIGDLKFNPDLTTSEDVVFINQILLDYPKIGLCNRGKYYYRKREEKSSLIDNSTLKKEFFTSRLNFYFKFLILKSIEKYDEVPQFIQYTLMYDLQWLFDISSVNNILTRPEIENLHEELFDIIQYIDDEVIYNQKNITNLLKAHILVFKYKRYRKGSKYGKITKNIIDKLKLNTVYIDVYEIVNSRLHILANLPTMFDNSVEIYVNDERLDVHELKFPQRDKYSLSHKYCTNYSFEVEIPLKIENKYEIKFKSTKDKTELLIEFSRPCNFSNVVGYAKTRDYISTLENNTIIVKKRNSREWVKQEIKTIYRMLKNHKKGYKTGVPIRTLYLLAYPYFRHKRIWLFMDLPNIADDNAIQLFKYAQDRDPEIEKFFILERDSKNWDEVKKIGKVIPYKSIKHRFIALYAEKIVTSHPDNNIIYPFWGNYPYFAGLLKSSTIFLQHGITKDNVSSWLNEYDKHLAMFLTSSKYEYKSIFEYPYNYKKEVVKLLGFPRFDKLERKEDKKQILIMPTWRRYLKFKSNEVILNSQYFKKFNSLINNEKLIEAAKQYGYEIIFKPHPNVYDYINLFDRNENVKIDYDHEKYQDTFNHGSLLITDYSSVAFDFAYLNKPVIYYQYSRDYHFNINESYFNYDTMGFGEICRSEDTLVNEIIEYMKSDCELKDVYKQRIENYFLFRDKNNSMRVYDAIRRLPRKV
ncbi:CDP-glycerol glycerophosphotransferase family protein [Methanobrevibacter sp.]|uniref:bifunctional glycosyltransferase/CDP-glycerol:glycerophosphate glycerophosphotransferase n=1 Tax=Methanobrevibacter sp. TaxID=66852 RepID=UPI00388DC37A